MACLNGRGCFGKRLRQLVKKIIVLFIIQTTAWFLYTYIEEGFLLTDCIFNQEKINRLKETKKQNVTRQENELYAELDKIFLGDLDRSKFEIYHAEFKSYFNVKEPVPTKVSIHEICTKWYLFTAITLTTVGYGNVVPKTMAGKLLFFPFILIGIPTMLFFLGYVGQLLAELCSKIVELLSCRRTHSGEYQIAHKELKSFLVIFIFLWAYILLEAMVNSYYPDPELRLSFLDGVYFYFVSFTTIGYGDITAPMTQPLFEFRLYVGLSLMSGVVSAALDLSQKIAPRRIGGDREGKCCCKMHQQSCDIEPAVEMVVVQGTYTQKEANGQSKTVDTARDNKGYKFEVQEIPEKNKYEG